MCEQVAHALELLPAVDALLRLLPSALCDAIVNDARRHVECAAAAAAAATVGYIFDLYESLHTKSASIIFVGHLTSRHQNISANKATRNNLQLMFCLFEPDLFTVML